MLESGIGALITGGAKRIGRSISLDLAAHGFPVAIHSNDSIEEAETLAQVINRDGGFARVVQANLTDSVSTSSLVDRAVEAIGPIGIVVNNASIFENDSLTDFNPQVWDDHFAIHVKAPSLIAQAFARYVGTDAEGLIVNMIDQRVWRPNPRFYSYTLSKAALWMATQTMAQALAPNIRVNAIGPGPTLANERQRPEDFEKQVEGLILRRGPDLPHFGATVRYLWETPSITGQMIALDGGQHLAWETPDIIGMAE